MTCGDEVTICYLYQDTILNYYSRWIVFFWVGEAGKNTHTSKQTAIVRVIKKLMFRVWFFRLLLVLCVAICEDKFMRNDPDIVNLWFIIFEIISAYSKYLCVI